MTHKAGNYKTEPARLEKSKEPTTPKQQCGNWNAEAISVESQCGYRNTHTEILETQELVITTKLASINIHIESAKHKLHEWNGEYLRKNDKKKIPNRKLQAES